MANISEVELGRLKLASSESNWNNIINTVIKPAHGGRYPDDWWPRVIQSGLAHQVMTSFGADADMHILDGDGKEFMRIDPRKPQRLSGMETTTRPRKPGAPRKSPAGLTEVLYIRATPDLIDALDLLAERERTASPGRGISRADVAREILYKAITTTTARENAPGEYP